MHPIVMAEVARLRAADLAAGAKRRRQVRVVLAAQREVRRTPRRLLALGGATMPSGLTD